MEVTQDQGGKGLINVEKLEAELKGWGLDLRTFKSRAEKATSEVKSEYEKQWAALRAKCDDATLKLKELKKAGGVASTEMEKGIEAAWADLKKSFGEARRLFKEKGKES